MRLAAFTLALLPFFALAPGAHAKGEIYKWVDKDGVVHYSGEPPSKDAKPADLPQLQTYKPSAQKAPLPTLDSSSTPSKAGASVSEIRITSPQPEEVLRENANTVMVSAAVLPAAPAGVKFAFYLDGKLQNAKASPSPSLALSGIERGSHTVVVAVLDAAGRELKRSAPVTFHSQPPRAR